MDFQIFDFIIIAILAFSSGALLLGKGDFLLEAFRNKADRGKPFPYDRDKYAKCMGILCLVMLIAELIVVFSGQLWAVIASIVVVVVAFTIAIIYLKKYGKVNKKDDK